MLRLSWQAPAEPRGLISFYEVRFFEQQKHFLVSQSHSDQHFLSQQELSRVVTNKLSNYDDPDVISEKVANKDVENEQGCFYDVTDLKKNATYFFQV